jgi:hypothetical protein
MAPPGSAFYGRRGLTMYPAPSDRRTASIRPGRTFTVSDRTRTVGKVNVWGKVSERCCIAPTRHTATLVREANSRDDGVE